MKELKFTATDNAIRDLDIMRERCGLDTHGQVVGHALRLYVTLSEMAADGVPAVKVALNGDMSEKRITQAVTAASLTTAYVSARETERALLPSAPTPVAPAPTPAPARPWWQFWSRV